MGDWKHIDCSQCEATSQAQTTSGPEFSYCPVCQSEAVSVFQEIYSGGHVDMFDCTDCSHVFNLSATPEPGYCPVCGASGIGRFP